jgi:thiamine pyrophosphate-dependent acetolactate synthase large subunit-like protein
MPSTTREYLEVLSAGRDSAVVVTTMTASKIWPSISADALDFDYLPSAMSHAADIALGIALAAPDRRVVCVNGDGSLSMNLGGLITAADCQAMNLTMLVMENGTYEVVGGGRAPGAGRCDYGQIAAGCGWTATRRFDDAHQFAAGLPELFTISGPVLATLAVADPPDMPLVLPAQHPRDALRRLRGVLGTILHHRD